MLKKTRTHLALLFLLLTIPFTQSNAQDWIRTGTNRGAPIRLAVPDFKQANAGAQTGALQHVFDETLWYDLENAGIFTMVAKSFYPAGTTGAPMDIKLDVWGNPPTDTAMVAFGNLGVSG